MPVSVKVINGNIEGALVAFKSKVMEAGILEEYRDRQQFTKPSVIKREKKKAAIAAHKNGR